MIFIFSSPPFYTAYVHLPTADDPVPSPIHNNPKFWPFFNGALAVIDGSHIHCAPPTSNNTQNSGLFLMVLLLLKKATTFNLPPPHWNEHFIKNVKALDPKIVF